MPDEGVCGRFRMEGGGPDSGQADSGGLDLPPRFEEVDRNANDGEVPRTLLELLVRVALARAGLWNLDLGKDLVRLQRRRERV